MTIPDGLAKDYTEGELSVRQIAERYNMSVSDVQQYAFDNDLSHGGFGELVKRGAEIRKIYGSGQLVGFPVVVDEAGELVKGMRELQAEVKSRHRYAIDSMFTLHELLTQSAILEAMSIADPARYHPDDPRVRASKAMRGSKESIADQGMKLAKMMKEVIDVDLNNHNIEQERAEKASSSVQVNVMSMGANQTAIDERSKLAAVAGMLEMLKIRKEESNE
jgi:hypothetical protein